MYIILLLLIILLSLVARIYPSYRNVIGKILTIVLIIIAGFRYNVGMDYKSYNDIYNSIKDINTGAYETGFIFLCKACSFIGGTSQLMFLTMSILTIVLLYQTYKKYSPDLVFTLVIFICFGQMYLNTFNAVRQCLAISLFAYSIDYLEHKQFIRYSVSIILATLFHSSAILLFPLYWILDKKWNKNIVIGILIGAILLSGIIVKIINSSSYAIYLRFNKFAEEVGVINYIYLAISLAIFVFGDKIMEQYKDRYIFLNINSILLVLFVLYIKFSGTPMVMVVGRFVYYFIFFYAIIFARMVFDIKNHVSRFNVKICVYAILILMFLRTTLLHGTEYHLLPYHFNFQLF